MDGRFMIWWKERLENKLGRHFSLRKTLKRTFSRTKVGDAASRTQDDPFGTGPGRPDPCVIISIYSDESSLGDDENIETQLRRGPEIAATCIPPKNAMASHHVLQTPVKESQYTDGSERIISASDGQKSCLSLLLTGDLVKEFTDTLDESRKVQKLEEQYEAVKPKQTWPAISSKHQRQRSNTPTRKRRHQIHEEIEQRTPELLKSTQQCDDLEELLRASKRNLKFSQLAAQTLVERAMLSANLYQPVEPLIEFGTEEAEDDAPTAISNNSSEAFVNPKDSKIHAARGKLDQTEADLVQARQNFYTLRSDLDAEREAYHDALRQGRRVCTESAFAGLEIRTGREITRALIDAEEARDKAIEEAQELGILDFAFDLGSSVGQSVDGYRESEEAEMVNSAPRERIYAWMDGWHSRLPGPQCPLPRRPFHRNRVLTPLIFPLRRQQ